MTNRQAQFYKTWCGVLSWGVFLMFVLLCIVSARLEITTMKLGEPQIVHCQAALATCNFNAAKRHK
jgi:hypothetical protein